MKREISSVCGQNVIRITDKITNFGSTVSPYTILYHMNFGYPLLSEDAELVIDPSVTNPRDVNALPILQPGESTPNILEIIVNDIPS